MSKNTENKDTEFEEFLSVSASKDSLEDYYKELFAAYEEQKDEVQKIDFYVEGSDELEFSLTFEPHIYLLILDICQREQITIQEFVLQAINETLK